MSTDSMNLLTITYSTKKNHKISLTDWGRTDIGPQIFWEQYISPIIFSHFGLAQYKLAKRPWTLDRLPRVTRTKTKRCWELPSVHSAGFCSSSSVSSINLIEDYTNKVTATARGTSICTCTIGAAKVEDVAASSSSCSFEPLNSEAHNENGPCPCPSVAAVHVHLLRNNNKLRRRRLGDRRNNKRSTTDKDAIELALDSVVKIFTVSSSPNYFLPWQNKSQRESMGSGFVIPGKKILTNAHVVADHTFVLVRKHGSPAKYRAQVKAVGHECDLAILSVESEEFWNGVNSLELGDIPFLQEAVAVVGYPQGGDNISVTKGVVSRVEPTQYVHGATQLMAIQIDAAINPGNSGGPAIMGNKVAGVLMDDINAGYERLAELQHHFSASVNPNWPKSSSIRRRNPNTATRPSSLVIETVEAKLFQILNKLLHTLLVASFCFVMLTVPGKTLR
ncbi:hypothetical protein GBA52_018138 [Prunus armeniaca]|nr:hypothetical protein GBA52_018138 [Prunus armeniaca]